MMKPWMVEWVAFVHNVGHVLVVIRQGKRSARVRRSHRNKREAARAAR